jgi:hypothetical protein
MKAVVSGYIHESYWNGMNRLLHSFCCSAKQQLYIPPAQEEEEEEEDEEDENPTIHSHIIERA